MKKYTTVALEKNQWLVISRLGFVECYCMGYEDGKRKRDLDGWYFKSELSLFIKQKA